MRIPKDILSAHKDDEKVKHSTNRLKWIDISNLMIVNEEGIEIIFDIDNNFKPLSFNVIPLFNNINGIEWEINHYYKEREPLNGNDLL